MKISTINFEELSNTYRTPFFVYDKVQLENNVRNMQEAVGENVKIFYSVKANLNPVLIKIIDSLGIGFEVASIGELEVVLHCGVDSTKILFAGPGKQDNELIFAIESNILLFNVESLYEAKILERLCDERAKKVNICLRVNMNNNDFKLRRELHWFSVNQFGIQENFLYETLNEIKNMKWVSCIGLHLHSTSEIIDASLLSAYIEWLVHKCFQYKKQFNLKIINLGGGWGHPNYINDSQLDLDVMKQTFMTLFETYSDLRDQNTSIFLESGRYIVSTAGYYVSTVINVKSCRGKDFVILNGGINHILFQSSAFRSVKHQPLIYATKNSEKLKQFEIVGPLCTPIDKLGSSVSLPENIKPGDLVYFSNSGAYTKWTSPLNFLGHPWPMEILNENGNSTVIGKTVRMQELIELQQP